MYISIMGSDRDILADEVTTVMDDNTDVRETVGPSSSKRKKTGSATNDTTYDTSWETSFPIQSVKGNKHSFLCIPCNKIISCSHQGKADARVYCDTCVTVKETVEEVSLQTKIVQAEVAVD